MAESGSSELNQPNSSEIPPLSPTESETPLSPAASLISQESVSESVSSDHPEDLGNTELHFACMDFDHQHASQLLKAGASIARTNKRDRSCLHEMMLSYLSFNIIDQAGHYKKLMDISKLLLTYGLDVNMGDFKFQTPLHYVVQHTDQADVIRALTSVGVRVNLPDRMGQTCLHLAIPQGNMQNIVALMEAGGDPNIRDQAGNAPLHLAAKGRHHEEVVRTLIHCGARPDITNCAMKTPLHVAAKSGRHDIINVLLVVGADGMARDHSGLTPLHLAAGHDMTGRACATLLQWGNINKHTICFDINAIDEIYMETPLHRAVRMNMSHNIRSLVACDARMDVKDVLGDSVLHKAATLRDIGSWKNLMAKGHRHSHVQNSNGLTPFQLAAKVNNRIAINMMRQYGLFDY